MSVIVMGVDIPEDCDSCWLPGKYCNLWLATDVGERHRGCPIHPLPEKHGRLADVDAIMEEIKNSRIFKGDYLIALMDIVDGARTIVEAEGD